MTIVLDASAAVDALVPGQNRDTTRDHFRRGALIAPHLVDSEVASALARMERAGTISRTEADRAVRDWQRLPCERVSVGRLLTEIWELRRSIRITDAHYVALARRLGVTLLTSDARLARAPVKGVSILLIS